MNPETRTEKLMADIALKIHQSVHLDEILHKTVTRLRQGLNIDRVLVYRFEADWSGIIVAESVIFPWKAIFGEQIKDVCLTNNLREEYRNGRTQVVSDVYTANLNSCHLDALVAFQIRANLVVGIVSQERLWGLLIAQKCGNPRIWQGEEIQLCHNISHHIGVAIYQAELHEKITCFNHYLEVKIKERTAQLKQRLQFEELVQKITDKIRYSLNEETILQTLTQELAQLIPVNRCQIDLYNPLQASTTIVYEYAHHPPLYKDVTVEFDYLPNFYQQLFAKQTLQLVVLVPLFVNHTERFNHLACPIFDREGVLGNLWLIRSEHQTFNHLEIEFVQQIAAQCAIAIRQARLYQASQLQVQELERLNTLKDDFLKTISHELKTPISNITVGIQTLTKIISEHGSQWYSQEIFHRVFNIIYQAGQQQKQLVDDLLALCYLDAEEEIVNLKTIYLQTFIRALIDPFQQYAQKQKQELIVEISPRIKMIKSDPNILKRIITELLNNACKYTPPEETITLEVSRAGDNIQFKLSNSGVEIPAQEIPKIFEKLYRIPNNDPWKYGGTGLGLTLVKKLLELLQGKVSVISENQLTQFIVEIPSYQKEIEA